MTRDGQRLAQLDKGLTITLPQEQWGEGTLASVIPLPAIAVRL